MLGTRIRPIILLIALILACVNFALAVGTPEGPGTITVTNNTRRIAPAPLTQNAAAGNLSWVRISGETVTQSWQGYAGNVTGTITLDDALNNTLYDWTLGDPEGEVYATYLSTVDWTTGNVVCWNWSNSSASNLQLVELEQTLAAGDGAPNDFGGMGAKSDDVDGIDETFNYSGGVAADSMAQRPHSAFYVGGQLINGTLLNGTSYMRHPPAGLGGMAPCPNMRLFNNTADDVLINTYEPTSNQRFEEVILYYRANMGNGDGAIFASIIRNSKMGYNNQSWDFEMIVPEDGHAGNTASTTYYFYVELE